MLITNKHNLPQAYVNLVERFNTYSRGDSDVSVTQLIGSPRISELLMRHDSEIEVDVADMYFSLLGTMAHMALERNTQDGSVAERRIILEMDGMKVSGQADVFNNKIITDYKFVGTYSVQKGDKQDGDWKWQLNTYAELFRSAGFRVDSLRIFAMLRDWSKLNSKIKSGYPEHPVVSIPIKLLSSEEIRKYMSERIALHKAAKSLSDADLPPCTREEMWQRPDEYLVTNTNNKTLKRCDSYVEAERASSGFKVKTLIRMREGVKVRCNDYCLAAPFCNLFNADNK